MLESLRLDDVVEEFCGGLRSVDSQPVTTKEIVRLKLHLGPMKEQEEFVAVPHCEPSVILGLKFLNKHKFIVIFGKNKLSIPPLSPEPLKMRVGTNHGTKTREVVTSGARVTAVKARRLHTHGRHLHSALECSRKVESNMGLRRETATRAMGRNDC